MSPDDGLMLDARIDDTVAVLARVFEQLYEWDAHLAAETAQRGPGYLTAAREALDRDEEMPHLVTVQALVMAARIGGKYTQEIAKMAVRRLKLDDFYIFPYGDTGDGGDFAVWLASYHRINAAFDFARADEGRDEADREGWRALQRGHLKLARTAGQPRRVRRRRRRGAKRRERP